MKSWRTRGNDGASANHHHPWPVAGRGTRCVYRMVPPQAVPPVGFRWLGHLIRCGTKVGFYCRRRWRSKILARRLGDQAGPRRGRHTNHGRPPQHPALGCCVRHRPVDDPLHQALGRRRTRQAAAVLLRALLAAGHRASWHHDHRRYFQPLRLYGNCRAVQLRADRLRQGPRLHGCLQLSHHGHHGCLFVPTGGRVCFCQNRHAQYRRRVRHHPRAWPIAGSVRRLRAHPAWRLGEDGLLPVSRLAAQLVRLRTNGQHRAACPLGHEGLRVRDAPHHGHGVFHRLYHPLSRHPVSCSLPL